MMSKLAALMIVALCVALLPGCSAMTAKPQDVLALACDPSSNPPERCAEAIGDVYALYQKQALARLCLATAYATSQATE